MAKNSELTNNFPSQFQDCQQEKEYRTFGCSPISFLNPPLCFGERRLIIKRIRTEVKRSKKMHTHPYIIHKSFRDHSCSIILNIFPQDVQNIIPIVPAQKLKECLKSWKHTAGGMRWFQMLLKETGFILITMFYSMSIRKFYYKYIGNTLKKVL